MKIFQNFKISYSYKDENEIISNLSYDNANRIRTTLVVLSILQIIQLVTYQFSNNPDFKRIELTAVKAAIVILSVVFFHILGLIIKGKTFFSRHAKLIISCIVFLTLIWSIINTFVAQVITSDISIYILMIFAITAVVRLRPPIIIIIYSVCYLLFAAGIPLFQYKELYLASHRINGFILNIVAIMNSIIFYRYSVADYIKNNDIQKKNQELLYLAQRDGLTSLFNHKTMHDMLDRLINSSSNKSLYLVLLDLDNFKKANDQFGHKTGDEILKKTAEKICQLIRNNDIAGRYGGDEFMIVITDLNFEEVHKITSKLLEEVSKIEVEGFKITFSCGIAIWEGESADQLVEKADKLMYKSKKDGRNLINSLVGTVINN